MKEYKIEHFSGIYRDFAENLGIETTLKVYKHYRGLQVVFPTRIFSKEYIKQRLVEEYNNGIDVKTLAKKYEYSERWIRTLIKEAEK
ncbi:MAG: Mor transcription activator family protein [Clostridia bacterium]|nr:Mor transcription activator family protein [Clostridia bacterium]